ncbi:MAG: helix-hairpin-helix domain-containing protein [Cyanobacteria bacterium SIG26]|nr:helix-hairpin-helix domain-containing protein [Cyanobacteria bacterium SIG26]
MWHRRRMSYGRFDLYVGAVVAYILAYSYVPDLANFLLFVFVIGGICVLVFRTVIVEKLNKNSIKLVAKQFVKGTNVIGNSHCTVKYSPDEQIIIMDNHSNQYNKKRMFTIKKGKINKYWNSICKVFDEYVSLDSYAALFSLETDVDIISIDSPSAQVKKRERRINIDNSNIGPKYVEISDIQKDTFVDGTDKPNIEGEKIVEINDIKPVKETVDNIQSKSEVLVDMSAVMAKMSNNPDNKIDINNATESEISLLPSVNIIIAKKIIEYRNKNRSFKSEEEFIEVLGAKPHFVTKIKSMIYLGDVNRTESNDDDNQGRIVDF